MVNALLLSGADILLMTRNGISIPGAALISGHNDLAMYLINVAIPEAIRVGDSNRILELVESGGNPNAVTSMGWTPLIYMVSGRDYSGAERLLHSGANVNAVENDGWSALLFAVTLGDEVHTRSLL